MSRCSPPTRTKQQTFMLHPILGLKLDSKHLGWASPELASTLCSADKVFLVIDAAEYGVTPTSYEENCGCVKVGEVDRILGEVLGL